MLKLGGVIKNISYSFSANLISLLISAFMVMFVPKLLSVNDYGLWQLFCSIILIWGSYILDGKMEFIFDMLEKSLRN